MIEYFARNRVAANLLMALFWGLPIRLGLIGFSCPSPDAAFALPTLYQIFSIGVFINLLLMGFNLIPIPPLDGFTILLGVLPPEMAYRLTPLRQYGMLILLAAIFILPQLGIPVLSWFYRPLLDVFLPLLTGPTFGFC